MDELENLFLTQQNPNNEFQANLIQSKYKKLFNQIDETQFSELEYNFFLKYSIYLSTILEQNIEQNLQNYQNLLNLISEETKFSVFYTLLQIFLKESWLGPSTLYKNINQKLKCEKKDKDQIFTSKKFQNYDFTPLKPKIGNFIIPQNLNSYNHYFIKLPSFIQRKSDVIDEYLQVDGEQWIRIMPNSHLFVLIKELILHLCKTSPERISYSLWKGRILFIHNQILYDPCGSLYTQITESFNNFFDKINQLNLDNNLKSQIKVEFSHALIFYYKYEKSERALQEAQNLIKIKLNLTGKLGMKTKFQTIKTAQLIAQVHSTNDEDEEPEEEQKFDPVRIAQDHIPKNVFLDDECILFETPKIEECDNLPEKTEKSSLNVNEQILVLGFIKHLDKTMPHEELFHEQVMAYCNILINKSNNWLVYTNSLFRRSRYEMLRFKRMERGLAQLEELLIEHNEKSAEQYIRGLYLFSLNYPFYIELQKLIAQSFFKIGMVMSACQIYERLEMYEESIECVACSGQTDKAKKMCNDLFEKNFMTPKLLCIYGDITKDIQYYKKAWKHSKKRYSKAQLYLGRQYFYKGLYEKSVKAFRKSIKINSYNSSAWFTQGCAHLQLVNWKDAIECFSTVVTIDESQGEAWANLSNAFQQLGKRQEAQATLEQAVKHCERSWQMWSNLMRVSLTNQKFFKFFECIEKLVNMDHKELIDQEVFKKIIQVASFNIKKYPLTEQKRNIELIIKKIQKVFTNLGVSMGQNPLVWKYYGQFWEVNLVYEEMILENQSSLLTAANIEENQLLKKKYQEKIFEIKNQIADLKLKQLHVTMVIGWEIQRNLCENVLEIIQELIEAYKDAQKSVQQMGEVQMLINSLASQIENTLERKIDLKI